MAGLGDKKRFDVHFRLTDEQGDALLELVRKLDSDITKTCSQAIASFLETAATAPAELVGPRLLVFILDRLQAKAPTRTSPDPPGVDKSSHALPTRPMTRTKAHKPPR